MSVQLKDIAKHLNISISTVSRVINGTGRVSAETRERILKAIKEFGYQPNEIARSLKRKSAHTLGVIVPDLSNSFYGNVMKGVEKVASENEHTVIVCNSGEDIGKEEEYVQLLLQKQVTGLVIATVGANMELFDQYKNSGIPIVFIDNMPQMKENFDVVTIDNAKASYDLTEHLIRQGHEKLAIITGPQNQSTAEERLQGFRSCMEQNGRLVREHWIGVGEFKRESGYSIMKSWLEQDEIPTAVFAANDFLLYGAIKAIIEKGLKIPQDIACVCFDANDETGLLRPQITSIIQPAEKIGSIAADIIMRREKNKDLKMFQKVVLEPTLIINESSLIRKGDRNRDE
ncbi:LacI family transcriptional regulator [Paenibacillus sp. J5C_2022]|uniref:LacI family DNA-binding transcriptional regulator n=1 Tax=Paenibacillus sp. J5C2022 TaxID=2977129 RepID=UPI0021D0CBDD|nr:LacI family DNA-binding transcriptional regulator [Paenibacillus sp. J5C2022]MCU6709631.1 LacI family transcriptional regulator [Paenibacillus sp. J5C2022]